MDIEDRLKLLRKERRARSRAQSVRSTWEKLESDETLTVKEKLERLISLTRQEPARPPRELEEDSEPAAREGVRFFENGYALDGSYGQIPVGLGLEIPGEILAFLSRDAGFAGLDLSTSIFLDLETTGLAGGTGTVPFLVGLGYYRDEKFMVGQYFLGDLAEEERFIDELVRFFKELDVRSVVTYNGKAFDLPILETRFILHRRRFPLAGLPHLDFLFSARGLWRHKYESCRLCHLAREIVQAERGEDIPSAEVPVRYFQYLRNGDFSLLEPVLYHNQEDILSLLGVITAGAVLAAHDPEAAERGELDAMDLVGVARLHESAGNIDKSVTLFEKALQHGLTGETSVRVKRKLSTHFKRSKEWSRAVTIWQEMTAGNDPACFRELAMYYEHREKNYGEALKAAEEGLAVAMDLSLELRRDFEKRIERLKVKIERHQGRR
ncbi:MAG: ribonuclease H-like domain-containing protein [Candidatus Aminicenantes bacterium]|nr:ribonuclease H-like domain-containing protein [Candidatus Aminicenantes bacterium]